MYQLEINILSSHFFFTFLVGKRMQVGVRRNKELFSQQDEIRTCVSAIGSIGQISLLKTTTFSKNYLKVFCAGHWR